MEIKNVKIINYNHIIENANIIIENNKIKKIIKKMGQGTKIIIPGFIEPHIHGFSGYDVMDSREAIEEISKELPKVGVTSFFPTLMTASWHEIKKSLKNASKARSIGAKIAGIHLEGPFISKEKKGAHDSQHIISASKAKIKELYDVSQGKLLRITYAPEVNDMNLIKYMSSLGIVVNIGHSNASSKVTREAVQNGATSATHLWNGMSGAINRSPGVVVEVLQNANVFAELICDLIHVDLDTIKLSIKTKTAEKIVVVSDSISPAGLPNGKYKSGGQDVIKKDNLIKVVKTNFIAGGASSMNMGFHNLVSMGYDLQDIVKMTSHNIVINHNLKQIGVIKKGYFADFISLDQKFNIQEVFVNGQKQNI